jgi:hypothetical protein
MSAFLGFLGFLGIIVFGIMALVGVIKKNGKGKKRGMLTAISAVLFIIGLSIPSAEPEQASTEPDQMEETTEGSKENESKEEKKEEPKEEKKEEPKEKKPKTYGIGETATVADVGFTVNSVKTKNSFEGIVDPIKPSGKFIVVDITIKNGQKEALSISDSFFKIKKKDGTTYEPSSDVMFAIPAEKQFFLEQINPGLKKSGLVVFDVPKDLNLKTAVLHCQTGFFGTETIEINLK